MSALMYRRAFADNHTLKVLSRGVEPSMDEVRRRIFVVERASNPDRPDHFYKNYLHARLGHVQTASELPWAVLSAMAERFVQRVSGRLAINGKEHGDWLNALPFISPLAICVAFLVQEGRGPEPSMDPRPFLHTELGDTALLAPAIPGLDALIEQKGLNELHMHLNGSTELDIIWPDACADPHGFRKALDEARNKNGSPAEEMYDQLEAGLTPLEIFHRLRAARRVRHEVAAAVRARHGGHVRASARPSMLTLMAAAASDEDVGADAAFPLTRHPADTIHGPSAHGPLVQEAAWLYSSLQLVRTPGPDRHLIGLGLHFNLLVLTQIARMTVQQVDQVGFDQFQKYTVVGTREKLEKKYEARFLQLNVRPPHNVLTHLEGRLAPKKTAADLIDLLVAVVEGYLDFRGCPCKPPRSSFLNGPAPGCMLGACPPGCAGPARGRRDAELSLVVHFIKLFKTGSSDQCLDAKLRRDLNLQADVLVDVLGRYPLARQIVTGIDAASNELHAAPEVFGPTFRSMRRRGVERATFHVGEDFAHLTSGIRATAEALTFLRLGAGDRIGHGTALGVSPTLWIARTGTRLMLPIGEQLDNAVFAWMTLSRNVSRYQPPGHLVETIARLSALVHGRELSPSLLHRAWQLRSLNILEIVELEQQKGISPGDATSTAEAAAGKALLVTRAETSAEMNLVAEACRRDPLAYAAFRERHRREEALKEMREVDTAEIPAEALMELQDIVLGDLNAAGVAIETLPTSNVRIGIYHGHEEHHLFRWLGLAGEPLRNLPTVCVGTDDTGIFATSLRNEYAAIWNILLRHLGKSAADATTMIETLNRNGYEYRFRPSQVP